MPGQEVEALAAGAVDAAVLDASRALLARHEQPRLRVADQPLVERPLSLALRRENRGLQMAIDRILTGLEQEGALAVLAERWFGRSG
jgi:ABC-type amino acid transport substrate-binding protein